MSERTYWFNEHFEKQTYLDAPFKKGDYEHCVFEQCNLTEQHLSGSKFSNCTFRACNLSMTKLNGTVLNEVSFVDCKLLGLHFDVCDRFGFLVSFDTSLLDYSSFYQCKMAKTVFKKTQCVQVDFTECDLSLASFEECNLDKAVFDRTHLEKADFRTAYRYCLDPEANFIKHARFSVSGIHGLLQKYQLDIEP